MLLISLRVPYYLDFDFLECSAIPSTNDFQKMPYPLAITNDLDGKLFTLAWLLNFG